MSTVIAAIDDSAAARPVLATAQAVAAFWDAHVEALHVTEDDGHTALGAADAADVPMRVEPGDVAARLVEATTDPDVVAIVIGARARPGSRRPAGHVVVELITRCAKLVIVVPPDARHKAGIRRLVIALEGTALSSDALKPAMELGHRQDVEVLVVHVDDEASIPLFSDQPQHETRAFATEFLARYGTDSDGLPALELRVGEPAEQVLSVCDDTAADMLVVAWSCSLASGRARFVRHVLEHSHIPVMLVPCGPG